MNGNVRWSERTTSDFILFGMAFVGVVLGAIGVIVTFVPVAVMGFVLLFLALGGFMLKN
jgi:hypothetical protein